MMCNGPYRRTPAPSKHDRRQLCFGERQSIAAYNVQRRNIVAAPLKLDAAATHGRCRSRCSTRTGCSSGSSTRRHAALRCAALLAPPPCVEWCLLHIKSCLLHAARRGAPCPLTRPASITRRSQPLRTGPQSAGSADAGVTSRERAAYSEPTRAPCSAARAVIRHKVR